jgi:hypothetical protein
MSAIKGLGSWIVLFVVVSLTACDNAPVPTGLSYKETTARPNLTLGSGVWQWQRTKEPGATGKTELREL